MQCIMGCVLKSPKLSLLALIFLFNKLTFAEVANSTANSELRISTEKPHHLTSAEEGQIHIPDGKPEWTASEDPNSTLDYQTHINDEAEANSTLDYEPRLNDSVVEDFLKELESQQVAVVADAELHPAESHGAEYGHHKGHKTGFHKGTAFKAEKGRIDETGHKGIHKESHDGSHKKSHHKEAGTKYKGQEHKHQHFLKEADGSKGLKGHSHHSKGHHNKGNKANGHKNVWHKEESGRSKKFFDDYEHKKYHSEHDELNLHHKSKDNSDYVGGVIKAKKHHDSYGKKASHDEGKHHDSKKKVANSYGHKGHFDEHKGYNKKGGLKKAHADGHGGHGGGHGQHGAYSVHKPVKTIFSDSKDAKYLGSHSESVPTNAKMNNKYGDLTNAIPISLFVRKEDSGKARKPASKVQQGNFTGYLENSKSKEVKEEVADPEEANEISDTDETNQKLKPKKIKKVKTKVSKPLMIKKPFLIPEFEKEEGKTNLSNEERDDERPKPNVNSLIDIPLLQGEKTQQISIITRAELNPAASGDGKGFSKSTGHKASHIKASGEKGEKGGKKITGFKGHHEGDHHEKHHSDFVDKGAKDLHVNDHKKKFAGAHHAGKKGSKGHSHGSKGHHHKGHNDKGFKNVHHKVEYTVKKDFYHDNEDQTHHSNIDDFDTYFAKKRKQNLNDHEFYGKNIDDHYGFKGHHDQGHHHTNHKGHSKHYGHKGHHDHHHSDGHKDHHKKGHGAKHHHDHHGHHSHVAYDYQPY